MKLRPPYEVPRRWHVGDLCQEKYYRKYLIIGVIYGDFNSYNVINEHGQQYRLLIPDGYLASTDLQYTFTSFGSTRQDFQNGLFTPFFETI